MDTALALVQAYLNVNGSVTVVKHPVLEAYREGVRSVTDLDVLAFRFADAGHEVIRGRRHGPLGGRAFAPDPVLGSQPGRPDMLDKWGAVEERQPEARATEKGAI
jgi:hypothetical protein